MPLKIVLLAGDGVGPEVMREGVKVLKAVESAYGVSFDLVPFPCGGQHYLETGEQWPDGAFESCKAADAILLGAVGLPEAVLPNGDVAGVGVVFGLRFGLDLYANVRPTKLYPNVRHKIHDGFKLVWEPGKVDFVIVRENTEGLYTPTRGFLDRGGVKELAVDSRVITRKGAERVIRFAFELSKQRRRGGDVGANPRECAEARRKRRSQPDRHDLGCPDDVRLARPKEGRESIDGGGDRGRTSRRVNAEKRHDSHLRSRRHREVQRSRNGRRLRDRSTAEEVMM